MQKGFILIIFILIVGILSVGIIGGSWYYKNNFQKKSVQVNSQNPSKPVVSNLENTVEIRDWKSYDGDFFSFKYPQKWQINDTRSQNNIVEIYNPDTSALNGFGETFYIERLPFTSFLNIKTAEQIVDETQAASKNDMLPPGESFIRKKITFKSQTTELYYDPFGKGTRGWYVVFANGKNAVEFGPFGDEPVDVSIIFKILSTFTFGVSSKNPCISGDKEFCEFRDKMSEFISSSNFNDLLQYQIPTETTCLKDGEPFNPPVCVGKRAGEKVFGYKIGHNMSDGYIGTRDGVVTDLKMYVNKNGPFRYHGSKLDGKDNGIVVFTNSKKDMLIVLQSFIEAGRWGFHTIILGITSEDYLSMK